MNWLSKPHTGVGEYLMNHTVKRRFRALRRDGKSGRWYLQTQTLESHFDDVVKAVTSTRSTGVLACRSDENLVVQVAVFPVSGTTYHRKRRLCAP